jgi:UPF0755 protein
LALAAKSIKLVSMTIVKKVIVLCLGLVIIILGGLFTGLYLLVGPVDRSAHQKEVFTVALKSKESETVDKLKSGNFIRNTWAFNKVLDIKGKHSQIQSGGYYLSRDMNTLQVVDKLTSSPDMKWVVVKEGMRKEQIGELLAKTFNWSADELDKWNTVYTRMKFDYIEGVYFPDTYLIPVGEDGLMIANRMIANFNEKFAPYLPQFTQKDIMWTTAIKIASIIQRETADKADMPIIAGILWNRLNQGIKLEVDATVQYARGKAEDGWWAPITPDDIRNIDSPYNTYKYKGLPPHPISNPGLDTIEAVLNPTETDCIYYLHDHNKVMHCAKTYQEHLANIKKYL